MLLIVCWVVLYTVSILTLLFGINRLRMRENTQKMRTIDELTVLVPFRNEVANLPAFLECVYAQKHQPVEWIFVNDHSSDAFQAVFESMEKFPIRLLHLPKGQRGKKRSLRYGMDHVQTEYCLTMDADVLFGPNYIQSLLVLPEAELVILPVEMTGDKWWQSFFNLEYQFTTLLNRGMAGWIRPVNCSGANLLIHLPSFEALDDIEEHDHILSGDDMYTLRAFRNAGKRIDICENQASKVQTQTPETLSETMQQRVRWLGKTGNVADSLNNLLGFWALGLHLIYFLAVLIALFSGIYWLFGVLVLTKGMLDLFLINLDKPKMDLQLFGGVLLFELFYPIYLFALLGYLILSQPEWKGR